MRMTRTRSAVVAMVACAALTAGTVATSVAAATERTASQGPLIRYGTSVPEGATATVTLKTNGHGTKTVLQVTGFAPNTQYGAHAHVNGCDPASAAAAGPHYQYVQDPVSPSTNPTYANPQNEIWLDFTTNSKGTAKSVSNVEWVFPDDRRAKSVIIHAEHTHTGPTDSGTAGARLACVNVAF